MPQNRFQIQTFREPTDRPSTQNILNDPQTIIQEIIPKTVHCSVDHLIKLDKLPKNTKTDNSPETTNKQKKYSDPSSGNPLAGLLYLARKAEIAREQFKKES